MLMTVPQWLGGQEDWHSKQMTLRRLGDLILRMLWEFDEAYPRPSLFHQAPVCYDGGTFVLRSTRSPLWLRQC